VSSLSGSMCSQYWSHSRRRRLRRRLISTTRRASPSHAAAAASIDPPPGPEYMRPELTSGGNAPESIFDDFGVPCSPGRLADVAADLAQRAGGFGDHRRGELEHVDLARPYLHFDRHAGGG
jgi:hypothetical protein